MAISPLQGASVFPPLTPPAAPKSPAAIVPPASPGAGAATGADATSAGSATGGFGKLLGSALDSLNASQLRADAAAKSLANGGTDIAGALIATERASLQMQFALSVRDKALSAYQQIMAMQV